jgi:hypothetical protein
LSEKIKNPTNSQVAYTFHPQQPMSLCGLHFPSSTAHVNMWTTPSVLNSPCHYVDYTFRPQQPMSICGISPYSPTTHVNMWNITPFPNSPYQYVEYHPIPQQPMSICGISPHSPTAHVNMWNITPFPNSPQHSNMVTSCFTLHFHSKFCTLSQYCCLLLTNFYSYLNFSISIKPVGLIKLWGLGLYSLLWRQN